MNPENKVAPIQLEVALATDASEVLKKYSISEKIESKDAKVEFIITQNNQQLLRLCTTVFTTCPTGVHNSSPTRPCSHIVNC